ncbi:MAG: tRNA (adenosine(37)-N6)-threonylcarbamoyltransferase complex ATPase subunit type 1 TsaE [Nitrospiraceae bacterium]
MGKRGAHPAVKPTARKPKNARQPTDTRLTVTRSAAETERLGHATGLALRGGETLALSGELGSGKTVFVRGLAAGIGAPPRAVSSPTFVLIHEYQGRLRLVHADLYRIEQESELRHLGISDYQNDRTVLAIEWAEKAGSELPQDRLEIRLDHVTPTSRSIAMQATGPAAQACLGRLAHSLKTARHTVSAGRGGQSHR